MVAFSILPKIESTADISSDYCPYALHKTVESIILKFKEEHPDMYSTAALIKEVGN
jgi:hypothetical protein